MLMILVSEWRKTIPRQQPGDRPCQPLLDDLVVEIGGENHNIGPGRLHPHRDFKDVAVAPLAAGHPRVQQFEFRCEITKIGAERLMTRRLHSKRRAAQAPRPKPAQRRQLDLLVQQEIDAVEPGFRTGLGLRHLGQRRAEPQEFRSSEPTRDRGGKEQGFVEDRQHPLCPGALLDLRKQKRVEQKILLGQHHQAGFRANPVHLVRPTALAAILLVLDAALAKHALRQRGAAVAFEAAPPGIGRAAQRGRARFQNDDRRRREPVGDLHLVDNAARRRHIDDQVVAMLQGMRHERLCRPALADAGR